MCYVQELNCAPGHRWDMSDTASSAISPSLSSYISESFSLDSGKNSDIFWSEQGKALSHSYVQRDQPYKLVPSQQAAQQLCLSFKGTNMPALKCRCAYGLHASLLGEKSSFFFPFLYPFYALVLCDIFKSF